MSKKIGGPAFPVLKRLDSPSHEYTADSTSGMDLRDYFAAKAPCVPDDFGWIAGETDSYQRLVRWNYFYADAMVKAREL